MSKRRRNRDSEERELDAMWSRHHAAWRDPAQIASQWEQARDTDPRLLRHRARGKFWEVLDELDATLVVTREYEHLVMALTVRNDEPAATFLPLPHPSGLAFDHRRNVLHLASTRNPNQVYELAPVQALDTRLDMDIEPLSGRPLIPRRSRFYPGCTYLHDLALIGGRLHGNAVGQNAVVRFEEDGTLRRVWWPRAIETSQGPIFGQNHLQLNSIAAGKDLESSFFSASAETVSKRRPGHRDFPVDGRGVIFDGASREPMVRGLTRPHSARRHRNQLWVANSGYGEVGRISGGEYQPLTRLGGWTRGLALRGNVALVGTSRVIPRFRAYAPGLDVESSRCGLHAVDIRSGQVLGSLFWPYGNQVFAVEWTPRRWATGFPFSNRRRPAAQLKQLFYAFQPSARKSLS